MSRSDRGHDEESGLTDELEIDRICVRFEQCLREGGEPRIEEFLQDQKGPQRSKLLQYLLLLEFEDFERRNAPIDVFEYLRRFSGDQSTVCCAFAEHTQLIVTTPHDTRDLKSCGTEGLQREPTLSKGPARATPANEGGSAPPAMTQRVWGNFLLLTELGRGGMGEVHKAWDTMEERFVAIKRLIPEMRNDESACQRFRDEPRHMQKIRHEGIVQVLDTGEVDGTPYFAMELIDGTNLAALARNQALPKRKIAELMCQIAEAISFAHHSEVLHRDLKPANVLLTTDLSPKIADFGLAKDLQHDSDLTRSLVLGTLNYMSPEQAAGRSATPQTDVYGLGSILYELLTARPPFRGASPQQTLMKVQSEDVRPPRQVNSEADPKLEAICLRCLEKDPGRRYQSAQEVKADFDRVLRGDRQLAPRNTLLRRMWKRARQRPGVTAMTVVAVVAIFLVAILGVLAKSAGRRSRLAEAIAAEKAAAIFMQQAEWHEALDLFDVALRGDHPDPDRIRLDHIRCRIMAGSVVQADDILRTDAQLKQLLKKDRVDASLRRDVLLWRGSLLSGYNNKEAQELLEEAKKLPQSRDVADREFLDGLLAKDIPTAVAHFKATVSRKPHHVEARRALANCLFLSGYATEARGHSKALLTFVPDDIQIQLVDSLCQLAEGSDSSPDSLAGRFKNEEVEATINAFALYSAELRRYLTLGVVQHGNLTAVPLFRQLCAVLEAAPSLDGRYTVPPYVGLRLQEQSQQLAKCFAEKNEAGLLASLEDIAKITSDGTVNLLLSVLYMVQSNWRQAEKHVAVAESRRQWTEGASLRLYLMARIKWQFSLMMPEEKDSYQNEAIPYLHRLIRASDGARLPVDEFNQLTEMALQANEHSLAVEITERWQREYPEDPGSLIMRGIVEHHRQNYSSARQHYRTAKQMGSTFSQLDAYLENSQKALLKDAEQVRNEMDQRSQ